MRSSVYVAATKTAFLLRFGFAIGCVIAPSISQANVIINHLGIFARDNPDVEQGIDGESVTEPVQPTLEPDGPLGDSLQLGSGANGNPRIFFGRLRGDDSGRVKPLMYVPVTTPPQLA